MNKTADDVLNPPKAEKEDGPAMQEAKEFLFEYLADKSLPGKDVEHEASERSIAPSTLRRAREALQIRPIKSKAAPGEHSHGKWMWSLPTDLQGEEFPA